MVIFIKSRERKYFQIKTQRIGKIYKDEVTRSNKPVKATYRSLFKSDLKIPPQVICEMPVTLPVTNLHAINTLKIFFKH